MINFGLLVPTNGDKTRILCPECNGGSSRERSLIVSNDNGRISWYCFRDRCGNKGSIFTGCALPDIDEVRPPALRPYTGVAVPLDDERPRLLKTAYGIDARAAGIKWAAEGRYLLPIRNYYGDIMGWVARRPWGEPASDMLAKSLTYWHEYGPLLAWNAAPRYHNEKAPIVLAVEDQLSAIRAHQICGINTVALLGTGVNQEKIGAIQRHTDNLVIALDKDATGQAFAIARKWGQAFKSCRVLILERDIKDMPLQDLQALAI